jgi:hypothetical protein
MAKQQLKATEASSKRKIKQEQLKQPRFIVDNQYNAPEEWYQELNLYNEET